MWVQYTDGAWEQPEEEGQPSMPAGAGAVEFHRAAAQERKEEAHQHDDKGHPDKKGVFDLRQLTDKEEAVPGEQYKITWAQRGEVCTDPAKPEYIGACANTNNTGELTAMHYALTRALTRKRGAGTEQIRSDSQYAIHMTTGKWLPKKRHSHAMIHALRHMYRRLQRERPNEITLQHVRSHVLIPGNELADWLAETGVGHASVQVCTGHAEKWLVKWMGDHG